MAKHSKTHRRCVLCQETKDLTFFRPLKNGATRNLGYRYVCLSCTDTSYKKVRSNATARGIIFSLTEGEFETIRRNPCYYCGFGSVSGIDRIDSTVGYIFGNCAPCCKTCNKLKGRMAQSAFIAMCKAVSNQHSEI